MLPLHLTLHLKSIQQCTRMGCCCTVEHDLRNRPPRPPYNAFLAPPTTTLVLFSILCSPRVVVEIIDTSHVLLLWINPSFRRRAESSDPRTVIGWTSAVTRIIYGIYGFWVKLLTCCKHATKSWWCSCKRPFIIITF